MGILRLFVINHISYLLLENMISTSLGTLRNIRFRNTEGGARFRPTFGPSMRNTSKPDCQVNPLAYPTGLEPISTNIFLTLHPVQTISTISTIYINPCKPHYDVLPRPQHAPPAEPALHLDLLTSDVQKIAKGRTVTAGGRPALGVQRATRAPRLYSVPSANLDSPFMLLLLFLFLFLFLLLLFLLLLLFHV